MGTYCIVKGMCLAAMDAQVWNGMGKGQASRTVPDKRQCSLQEELEGGDAQVESMEEDGGGDNYDDGENDGGEDFEGSASDDGCKNA
eukprot:scaffold285063_cov18-Tisochrysis_lutea.AAC.1